jgi:hypothetical protein
MMFVISVASSVKASFGNGGTDKITWKNGGTDKVSYTNGG